MSSGTVIPFDSSETSANIPGVLPSPSLFSPDLNAFVDSTLADQSFELFGADDGRSSPGVSDYRGEDLHEEILSPSFEYNGAFFPEKELSVPDVGDTSMDVDSDVDAFTDLLSLEQATPSWIKADIDVKPEPSSLDRVQRCAAEESTVPDVAPQRPSTGPGSRRKVKEEIRDELDRTIYSLVPMEALRLPRKEFMRWKASSGLRKMTSQEQRRLAKIRRMILARVYAERTRLRKIDESAKSTSVLEKLKAENTRLRKKASKLEATQEKLRAQIKRLIAIKGMDLVKK